MTPFLERRAAAGRLAGTWPGARRNWASSRLSSSSSSSPAAAAEKEEDGKPGLFSSWIGKVKGVFQSKTASQLDFGEQASAVDPCVKLTPDYTLLACADELRKVRRLGKVTNVLNVTKKEDLEVLEKYEQVLCALAKQDPTGKCLDAQQRAAAAKECGCSIAQINEALAKFEWMKETRNNVLQKVLQSRSRGEGLPKTMEEVKKLFEESNALKWSPPRGASLYRSETKSPDVGRNCPCTCGSGKKYKRCCGRES